jgi:L-iditol 2-dehydrogenase
MKALVLVRDKVVELQDVPRPEPLGEDSVLVRISYSGICNSDLHRGFGGGAYRYPLIMGHELSGVVEESFPGSRYRAGDRVVVYPLLPCRRCTPCQTGDYAQCVSYDYFGSRRHGGFAEHLYVPEFNLLPIPEHVDPAHAALTEPCAVALHGVSRMSIRPGDSGCVFGGGPIGNMVAQWLALRGCRPVFVVDIDPEKLTLASDMGLEPIDAAAGDPVAEILSHTRGNGADRVVEAVGLPRTFLQATQAAARGGQVVFLGNIRGEFVVGEEDFSSILRRELTILGTWNSKVVPEGHNEWTTVLEFMDRGLRIAELISHTPTLEEGPEIFRGIMDGSIGSYRKIVFRVRP